MQFVRSGARWTREIKSTRRGWRLALFLVPALRCNSVTQSRHVRRPRSGLVYAHAQELQKSPSPMDRPSRRVLPVTLCLGTRWKLAHESRWREVFWNLIGGEIVRKREENASFLSLLFFLFFFFDGYSRSLSRSWMLLDRCWTLYWTRDCIEWGQKSLSIVIIFFYYILIFYLIFF